LSVFKAQKNLREVNKVLKVKTDTVIVGMTLTIYRIHISQWYVLCGVVDGLLIL
jgi:hypothetical protein